MALKTFLRGAGKLMPHKKLRKETGLLYKSTMWSFLSADRIYLKAAITFYERQAFPRSACLSADFDIFTYTLYRFLYF